MKLPPDDCEDCFKGVVNDEHIFGEEYDYSIFSDAKPVVELTGWNGSSVNWDLPDGEALVELLSRRKKDGEVQFKEGVARLPRSEIDKAIRRYGKVNLAYELREENGNIYHGHILFSQSLTAKHRTTIYAVLAYAMTKTSN